MAGATSRPQPQRSLPSLQSIPIFKANIKFKMCNSHKMEEKNTLEKKAHLVFKMGHRITKKTICQKEIREKAPKL